MKKTDEKTNTMILYKKNIGKRGRVKSVYPIFGILFFMCFFSAGRPPLNAEELPTLGVLPIFSQEIDKTRTNIIYDYIIDQINRTKVFSLVERAALDKALSEIAFSTKEIIDEKTASRIGKISGAEYILLCSVSLVDGTYYLSMRVVETESARIKYTSVKTTDSFQNIELLTANATKALLNIDSGGTATVPQVSKKLTGNYFFYDDRIAGGSSTISTGNVKNGVITLQGDLKPGKDVLYIGTGLDFNADGVKLMKKTKGFRIKAKGDNQYYAAQVKMRTAGDFSFLEKPFFISDKESIYTILYGDMQTPPWSKKAAFNRDEVKGIQIGTLSQYPGDKINLTIMEIEAITDEEAVPIAANKKLTGNFFFFDDKIDKGTSQVWGYYSGSFYKFGGTVTKVFPDGYIGMTIKLNAESRQLLNKAKGITFRVRGDGKTYSCKLPTQGAKDFDFHSVQIKAEKDFKTVTLYFKDFKQSGWGAPLVLDRNAIIQISFQTEGQPLQSTDLVVGDLEIIPE
jgi:hypothetical protein